SPASPNWWDHLVPVGLMWGNDVANIIAKQPSQEQEINDTRNPALHLGYRGLLNGPIDNPNASCMGCHGAADIAVKSPPKPSLTSFSSSQPPANAKDAVLHKDFDNVPTGHAISDDYVAVDYSLQLQQGIKNALKHGAQLPAGVLANTVVHGHAVAPRP